MWWTDVSCYELVFPHRNRISGYDVGSFFVTAKPFLEGANSTLVFTEDVEILWFFIIPKRIDTSTRKIKISSVE